ncbi:MAG: DUF5696 domain-containing protein [Phycisphaerae bacterium]
MAISTGIHTLENERLRAEVDLATTSIHVTDKAAGVTWRMRDESYDEIILERRGSVSKHRLADSQAVKAMPMGERALLLTFADFRVQLLVALEDNRLNVQLTPLEENDSFKIKGMVYPRPFELGQAPDAYIVLPFQHGLIVPGDWPAQAYGQDPFPMAVSQRMRTYSELFGMNVEWWSSRAPGYSPALESNLIMPWWGAVEKKASFLAVLDEDCWADSHLSVSHPAGGPTRYHLLWLPTWGKLGYPRRMTFHFHQGGDYVQLANEYRKIAQERGKCVTLRDKNEKNPTVGKLMGAATATVMFMRHHYQRYEHKVEMPFAKAAPLVAEFHKRTGIGRLHFHARGWQQRGHDIQFPDLVPPAPDCGGPVEFQKMSLAIQGMGDIFGLGGDNYHDVAMDSPLFDESMLLRYADGSTNRRNFWGSGLTSLICAGVALKYLRRNFEVGRTDYPSTLGLLETARPQTYWIGNYISSYECYDPRHPQTRNTYWDAQRTIFQYINDCGLLLNNEHPKDWAAPYFYMSRTRRERKGVYGYDAEGEVIGVPVPLWSLVFHDCVITGGDTPLFQLLNGAPPSVNMLRCDDKAVALAKTHALFHESIGFEPMTEHSFLSEDRTVQEAQFGNGVSVRIDARSGRACIRGVSGIPEDEIEVEAPGKVV